MVMSFGLLITRNTRDE